MTPVKLLLVVPTVRKAEEASGQPVGIGKGSAGGELHPQMERQGSALRVSIYWKRPSRNWFAPVWDGCRLPSKGDN